MSVDVMVENREQTTKAELKEMRAEGKIPAVVYGKKIGSELISIDEKQLLSLLRDHPNAILNMDIPKVGSEQVMVSDIQRDKITRQFLHVDFHQINMNEQVRTNVRLEFSGEAAGAAEGGILQIQKNELEIRCLPSSIPESISVDISGLQLGDVLTVSEVKLPDGVTASDHPDEVIVSILVPRLVEEKSAEEAEASKEEASEEQVEKEHEHAQAMD